MLSIQIGKEKVMDKKIKSFGGRPAGRLKTAKIEITIEPEIKDEFMAILRTAGKKASSEICAWIREYIKSRRHEDIK